MENRTLGSLTVSALGLGCMGMSEFYGEGDERESLATINAFLDAGGSLLDTADMYGPFQTKLADGKSARIRRRPSNSAQHTLDAPTRIGHGSNSSCMEITPRRILRASDQSKHLGL